MNINTLLARHCSAVFLEKKPSALFSIPHEALGTDAMHQALSRYNLTYAVLCDRCVHTLVFVYHPNRLRSCLELPCVSDTLKQLDYPADASLDGMLAHLRTRMQRQADFPHEIGFFLGYPAEDVLGFMQHKGQHCKLCGLWKVYSDVPRAKAMFAEYHACKKHVLTYLQNGGSLLNLPTGALLQA